MKFKIQFISNPKIWIVLNVFQLIIVIIFLRFSFIEVIHNQLYFFLVFIFFWFIDYLNKPIIPEDFILKPYFIISKEGSWGSSWEAGDTIKFHFYEPKWKCRLKYWWKKLTGINMMKYETMTIDKIETRGEEITIFTESVEDRLNEK